MTTSPSLRISTQLRTDALNSTRCRNEIGLVSTTPRMVFLIFYAWTPFRIGEAVHFIVHEYIKGTSQLASWLEWHQAINHVPQPTPQLKCEVSRRMTHTSVLTNIWHCWQWSLPENSIIDRAVFTQVEGLGINHEQKRPFLMINKTLIFPDIYLGNLHDPLISDQSSFCLNLRTYPYRLPLGFKVSLGGDIQEYHDPLCRKNNWTIQHDEIWHEWLE